MNIPEHDKLAAIAEGRQMEVMDQSGWINARPDEALTIIGSAALAHLIRIAPEQPAPTNTVTVPLTDEQLDVLRLETGYAAGPVRFSLIARAIERAQGIVHVAPAAPMKAVPLTDDDIWGCDAVMAINGDAQLSMGTLCALVQAGIAEFCRINDITHAATAGREGG